MIGRHFGKYILLFIALISSLTATGAVLAQTPTGTLRGQVTDPSGAAVVGASVLATSSTAQTTTAKTGRDGVYEMKGLAPDTYSVTIGSTGFALFENDNVVISPGQIQKLDAQLSLETQKEQVTVTDSTTTVDVNPANNASALIHQRKGSRCALRRSR